jgi:hypothetical protein
VQRLVVTLMACVLVVAACAAPAPEVIAPPGVTSKRTADEVARMMLSEISTSERTLGRRLAEPRIIRIQLLRPGEMYPQRRLDGSNPGQGAMGPSTQPGWMVEAIGTFVDMEPLPETWGTHGFHLWEDDGSEGFGFFPCGGTAPINSSFAEGSCP